MPHQTTVHLTPPSAVSHLNKTFDDGFFFAPEPTPHELLAAIERVERQVEELRRQLGGGRTEHQRLTEAFDRHLSARRRR